MGNRGDDWKIRVNGASFRFAVAFPQRVAPAPSAPTGPRQPEERLAEARDRIREARSATGAPPLVLIHGFPLNHLVWTRVSRLTAEHVLTIRPNLRGFGELSSLEPFTIASLADDLHALLSQIGALPCVLAGLSMGGYVGLALAAAFPADVAGLALVDSRAAADSPEQREKRDPMIRQVRRSGVAPVVDGMLPGLLSPSTHRGNPSVVEELQRIMLDTAAPTIEHACIAMRDRPDLTDTATRIDVPAAIIVGAEDQLTTPQEATALAEAMKQCELSVLSGAGHISPLEQPERVAEALVRLVKRAS